MTVNLGMRRVEPSRGWRVLAGWTAKEAADLNGDGYFDMVFQKTSGEVWYVDMAGGTM